MNGCSSQWFVMTRYVTIDGVIHVVATRKSSLNRPELAFTLPANDRRMDDRPTSGGREVNFSVMNEPASDLSGETIAGNVSLVLGGDCTWQRGHRRRAAGNCVQAAGMWQEVVKAAENATKTQAGTIALTLNTGSALDNSADAAVVVPAQQETDHGSGAGRQGSPACVKQIRPLLERQPDAKKLRF